MKFGDRIKILREESGLSREELSNKINITYAALSKYETNKRFPDQEILNKLANIFDVSIDYLLGRTNVRRFEDFPPEVKSIVELFASIGPSKAKKIEELLREVLEK